MAGETGNKELLQQVDDLHSLIKITPSDILSKINLSLTLFEIAAELKGEIGKVTNESDEEITARASAINAETQAIIEQEVKDS